MEGHDVSEHGEQYGRSSHRKLAIERCENGYIVKYRVVVPEAEKSFYGNLTEKTRVFLTNTDLLEFAEKYFEGEPRP